MGGYKRNPPAPAVRPPMPTGRPPMPTGIPTKRKTKLFKPVPNEIYAVFDDKGELFHVYSSIQDVPSESKRVVICGYTASGTVKLQTVFQSGDDDDEETDYRK